MSQVNNSYGLRRTRPKPDRKWAAPTPPHSKKSKNQTKTKKQPTPHVCVHLYNTRAQAKSATNVIILLTEVRWEVCREDGRIGTAGVMWRGQIFE